MDNLLSDTELDDFVLSQMPHFIAVNYQRLLTAQTPQEQVELALHTYNLGLRALTLGLVSQYLIRDDDRVSDPYLNELLLQKFPRLTLDAWQQLLFAALRAYAGKRALFFMPELYDFYWDDSASPPRQRVEVEAPFNRLTQLALEHKTGKLLPRTEADWIQLAAETKSLLTQILNYLAFIGRYDLIRVLEYNETSYGCERHKGLTLSIEESQPRPGHIKLIEGWFYLRRETADFLLLHPLLLFWQNSDESGQVESLPPQTGVYDNFIYERLRYMLPLSGRTVEDNRSVQAFIVLLDTIEEFKRQRDAADKLTWWRLRDLCAEITRQRMSTVRHKYRAELYLPRDKTSQALTQFLDSDKRCFVLIGKSGVGKSNFLLALGETLTQSRNDLCLLMYDGAHLGATASITDVISRDFDDRLLLAGRRVEQIWRDIAQIDGIEQRRVICAWTRSTKANRPKSCYGSWMSWCKAPGPGSRSSLVPGPKPGRPLSAASG
ncbi:MAG: hypothetical protein HC875_13715 [Anaerolineales bacterium]|nr:hypothetical protein [Anaerolineales bacterium]